MAAPAARRAMAARPLALAGCCGHRLGYRLLCCASPCRLLLLLLQNRGVVGCACRWSEKALLLLLAESLPTGCLIGLPVVQL